MIALAVYAVLFAASPALHHDFACHVKSPSHCEACVANPVASRTEPSATLDTPRQRAAGETPVSAEPCAPGAPVSPASGRAPPA